MAEITAAMVKELREKTDAPMMEIKKALVEAGGDLERAQELLRVKLGARANKAASRVAAEGVVAVKIEQRIGALVEVNCETDFVARNDDFLAFCRHLAHLVVAHDPADGAALAALPLEGSSVEQVRTALVGKIGENLAIRRFTRFETADRLTSYVHNHKIGVLVDFAAAHEQVGRDVAMHIAHTRPLCVSRDQVPAATVDAERKIFLAQAAESGKPVAIVERMVEGQVNKYLAQVALLGQPFVKNPDQSVEAMLKANQARVNRFAVYVVGEGIDKRPDDFAAEVAKLSR